jgi:ABC-type transporter Mla subunit MlaD
MSEQSNKTIQERIHDLARATSAPNAFVDQVRSLFTSKGISLADDATPYRAALEEAFRREQVIRKNTLNVQRNLSRFQDRFNDLGDSCRRQLKQLSRIRKSLQRQSKAIDDQTKRLKKRKTAVVLYSSDPRAYITKTLREDVPMVPGPKDVQ